MLPAEIQVPVDAFSTLGMHAPDPRLRSKFAASNRPSDRADEPRRTVEFQTKAAEVGINLHRIVEHTLAQHYS